MLTPKLIKKIQAVLDSDITAYRIAKEVGYKSASSIHNFRKGDSEINNMLLGTAAAFEKLYEEMMELENIKGVIAKIEKGELELSDNDPSYHERDYTDGATEYYIIHNIEGEELEVFFAEQEHVKEIRDAIYGGAKTEEDLIEHIEGINDLEDQFDYDRVVAYRNENGQIEWI